MMVVNTEALLMLLRAVVVVVVEAKLQLIDNHPNRLNVVYPKWKRRQMIGHFINH